MKDPVDYGGEMMNLKEDSIAGLGVPTHLPLECRPTRGSLGELEDRLPRMADGTRPDLQGWPSWRMGAVREGCCRRHRPAAPETDQLLPMMIGRPFHMGFRLACRFP